MRVERVRPAVMQLTMHVSELSTLLAAARWAAEGGAGVLPAAARDQLRQVIGDYDEQVARLDALSVTTPRGDGHEPRPRTGS